MPSAMALMTCVSMEAMAGLMLAQGGDGLAYRPQAVHLSSSASGAVRQRKQR